jgi:hypothetical protein
MFDLLLMTAMTFSTSLVVKFPAWVLRFRLLARRL